jgi:GNAT superfamily N-acetyltransferase
VVGVLRAYDFDGLISLDVEVDPAHQRKGYATRLYAAASAAGIDVEKGSRTSLATGSMTPLGYAFFAGRRAKLQ